MYNTFHDEDGNEVDLHKVSFDKLSQLSEVEEGFSIEYKKQFDDSVKSKLPQVVASFANSEGGLLFIGIRNEEPHDVCPCPVNPEGRAEWSQYIPEILKTTVSPTPPVDVRFIPSNDNPETGVVMVSVGEGYQPPYVSNGTVYVRTGSSKIPKAAESNDIIALYRKHEDKQKGLDDFFRRTVYFPPHGYTNTGEGIWDNPIFSIYLCRTIDSLRKPFTRFEDIDRHAETMIRCLKKPFANDFRYSTTSHSVIIQASRNNGVNSISPAIEISFDGGIKTSIPLPYIQDDDEKRKALPYFGGKVGDEQLDRITLVDASASITNISAIGAALDDYIEELQIDLSKYVGCFEREAMQGSSLFTPNETFLEEARRNGLPFCVVPDGKTKVDQCSRWKTIYTNRSIQSKAVQTMFSTYGLFDDLRHNTGYASFMLGKRMDQPDES